MPSEETQVIVGASLAGAKAAQALREEGFTGRLVLVGAETERPYERPPLTKEYLLGKEALEKTYVHEEDWYAGNNVELLLGVAAVGVDRSAHEVRLADGRLLTYDKLLLTTGASPRRLSVPGGELSGVHYIRTMADSTTLREAIRPGDKAVVVVGAGWIGLEVAAAAREYGNEVTIVEPEATPLHRHLGPELGGTFADLHRAHGVELVLGEGVSELRGSGRVSAVVTSGGRELPADIVVVGIGVVPNTGLAEAAGLEVSNGIVVDESLRTSDPDIYAAGDVANFQHPLLGRRIRVEHWANALNGGPAAARAMLGQDVSYDRVPYFFSDQYELGMETSGVPEPGEYDEVVYRGDPKTMEYIAFWLSGGRVVAGMNVNVWDVTDDIQTLIRSGRPVDKKLLADSKVPLADVP
ncbi:MAG TPA: FAD-dependent oxidoreductase [Streptosporangiaceae bacterium]|jgi:3-phenylpropionate/trans-cinnamate dioxygenase ferredoxin reductase subunit